MGMMIVLLMLINPTYGYQEHGSTHILPPLTRYSHSEEGATNAREDLILLRKE